MYQTLRTLFYSFLILGFTLSCQDEYDREGRQQHETVEIPLRCSVEPIVVFQDEETQIASSDTRAAEGIAAKESSIDNIWLFQFSGTGLEAKLVSTPIYSDLTTAAGTFNGGTKVVASEDEHRLVIVANTNNNDYHWNLMAGIATYKELQEKLFVITAESLNDSRPNLPMVYNDLVIINEDFIKNGIDARFKPSVAKIELVFNPLPEGLTVRSVQLRNVPSQFRWNEGAVAYPSESDIYPSASIGRIDYEAITDRVPNVSAAQTYVWYIPCNRLGETANTINTQKNNEAPKQATYIEILVMDQEKNDYRYRFYLGKNDTNNFNITAGSKYVLPLTIAGLGDPDTDSRIESLSKVVFLKANSYILNPPESGSGAKMFYIPIEQVNDFWKNPDFLVLGADPTKAFTESTEWVCEVIWHDNALLYDTQESADSRLTLTKVEGIGINDPYICVRLPHVESSQHGNVVIGIYNKNDANQSDGKRKYMWSWHLWVTDYNPDVPVSVIESAFTYPVPGGTVARYGGLLWGYNSGGQIYDNWTSTSSFLKPYAGKVIMDRHLGVRGTDLKIKFQTVVEAKNPCLLYQFGRKDPIVTGYYTIYNKNNEIILEGGNKSKEYYNYMPSSTAPFDMADAITNPTFISTPSFITNNIWLRPKGVPYQAAFNYPSCHVWNDVRYGIDYPDRYKKSLFDPCPPGWSIPHISCFDDLKSGKTTSVANSRVGLESVKDGVWGIRYWPYKEEMIDGIPAYPVPTDEEIFFAYYQTYTEETRQYKLKENRGFFWTNTSQVISFYKDVAANSTYVNSTSSLMVRCVQEQ